jgi:hypothetical protein
MVAPPPGHVRVIDAESIVVPRAEQQRTSSHPPEAWNLGNEYLDSCLSTLLARESEIQISASPLFPLVLAIRTLGFKAPRQRGIDLGWDGKPMGRLTVIRQPQVHQLVIPPWRFQETSHTLSFRSVNKKPGRRGRHKGCFLLTEIQQTSGALKIASSLREEGATLIKGPFQRTWSQHFLRSHRRC